MYDVICNYHLETVEDKWEQEIWANVHETHESL